MKKIGEVIHYYGKPGVAIVKLSDKLAVGDRIKIEGGKNEFDQEVTSMEIDREKVDTASKGSEVGIKVDEKARDGATVYKLEEEA